MSWCTWTPRGSTLQSRAYDRELLAEIVARTPDTLRELGTTRGSAPCICRNFRVNFPGSMPGSERRLNYILHDFVLISFDYRVNYHATSRTFHATSRTFHAMLRTFHATSRTFHATLRTFRAISRTFMCDIAATF